MKSTKYTIPKEHGAYVVLISSWIMGMIYSSQVDVTGFTLVLSVSLCLFLLQDPFKQLVGSKKVANPFSNQSAFSLTVIGVVSGGALVAHGPRVVICVIPLTVIGAVYFSMLRSRRRAIARSFVGFAGLTLVAPMTMIVADGQDNLGLEVSVWLFATLFFCTSIYCVAIRLKERHSLRNAIIYHVVAAVLIVGMAAVNAIPPVAIITMTIPIIRLLLVLRYRARYATLPIKYIGVQETVVAVCALAVIAVGQ